MDNSNNLENNSQNSIIEPTTSTNIPISVNLNQNTNNNFNIQINNPTNNVVYLPNITKEIFFNELFFRLIGNNGNYIPNNTVNNNFEINQNNSLYNNFLNTIVSNNLNGFPQAFYQNQTIPLGIPFENLLNYQRNNINNINNMFPIQSQDRQSVNNNFSDNQTNSFMNNNKKEEEFYYKNLNVFKVNSKEKNTNFRVEKNCST
jgi:hypothetical protein